MDDLLHSSGGFGRYQTRLLLLACAVVLFTASSTVLPLFLRTPLASAFPAAPPPTHKTLDLLNSVFFAANIASLALLSPLADSAGRRPVVVVSFAVALAANVATFAAPSLPAVVAARAVAGAAVGVCFNTVVVGVIEFSVPRLRAFVKAGIGLAWSSGILMCVGVAYALRGGSWRWIGVPLNLAHAVVLGVVLAGFPESPRFLLLQGKNGELVKLMQSIAKTNEVEQPMNENLAEFAAPPPPNNKHQSSVSVMELVHPAIRPVTLVVGLAQFSCTLMYYVILEYAAKSKHMYAATAEGALVEMPVALLVPAVTNYLGRKGALRLLFSIATVGLLGVIFFQTSESYIAAIFPLLVRFSGAGLSTIMFILAAESFPTSCRNIGVSWGNTCGKSGGLISEMFVHMLPGFYFQVLVVLNVASVLSLCLIEESAGRKLADNPEQEPVMTMAVTEV